MKTVFEFFLKKWVIQLLGIIALSLLFWFFGPLIAIAGHVPLEADFTRLVVILVMVVLWGINNLRVQLKTNRANAQMTSALVSPTETDTGRQSSEADADIAKIANTFDEALQTLKKGAKNAQGKHYLYDLPWYIIIGPPGSGKTTALINSGLDFPLADRFGKGALKGVGGTRNCDWWFTDQAVLLDTAGRYVTQDSHEAVDKAAWLGFLALLKKHRPRRPVNGVLITMSLSDLLLFSEQERSLHAQAIRQRIEELHAEFGIRFPIYMLFTKTDLIAGFNDFFAHLSKEERAQIWGVTFPEEEANEPSDWVNRVGKDFDDLLNRINEQLPRRLQEERDVQRRNLIFGFPQRIALLRENLLNFLQECYGVNRFQSAPYLRGFYFISGTQVGTPIDRLMTELGKTFQLNKVSAPLLSGKGKSYFITRLLKEVIFEEALIVGVNRHLERLQTLIRQGVYAGVGLIIVLLSVLWSISYNKNETAITDTLNKIEQYDTVAKSTPDWQSDFSALLLRMNALQAIKQVYADDEPVLMSFGLFQGDKLQPVIADTYQSFLQKTFLPLLKNRLEQRLKENINNPDMLYSLLEVYLMLGDTQRLKPELFKPWVAVDWSNTYPNDIDTQNQLLSHLEQLLTLSPEKQVLNERLIAAARQVLNRIPVAQQIYMRIKNDALETKEQDFNLLQALGSNADRVFACKSGTLAQQSIPYLYTYDGFYSVFLKQTKEQVAESVTGSWVLGNADKIVAVDSEQLEEAIREYYYQDYINYWDTLLANIKIKATGTAAQASEVLEFASSPDSPLRKLLEALNKETSLTVKPVTPDDVAAKLQQTATNSRVAKLLASAKAAGHPAQVVKPLGSDVEQHFLPLTHLVRESGGSLPIDRTLTVLRELYDYMVVLSLQGPGGNAADGAVLVKVKAESAHLPEPLKSMTQNLAMGNQGIVIDNSKALLNRLWQSEVMPLYQSGILGRYPFSRGSSKEVTLEDFGRFFGQNGIVDSYITKNLQAVIDTSGKSWRMNNQGIAISGSVLAQLQAAEKLKQMFFGIGGTTPLVKFSLKPLSLDLKATAFWLNIEGQQSKYSQNEMGKNATFQWPGTDGSRLVSFGFETKDGKKPHREIEGQWAWFRLLELAHIQKVDQEKYVLTFEVDGLQARYELSANSVDNPYSLREFDNFRLPSSL